MPQYADGFVIPIRKDKLPAYLAMARMAGKIWREHGALEYRECVGDDLAVKFGCPFPRGIRAKRKETIVFSWIVYKSKAHRDRVNAKVMQDERLSSMGGVKDMPFDMRRMLYGGFQVAVSA